MSRTPSRLPSLLLASATLLGAACGSSSSASTDARGELDAPPGELADARPQPDADLANPEHALTDRTFTEDTGDILNPERGFYDNIDLTSTDAFADIRSNGRTLAYAAVRLDAFRDTALPGALLTSLTAGFARVRAQGLKVILRFQYNDDANQPDASKSRVLGHIEQLRPLLRANADVIAVMQAGFIGSWGEWHDSTNDLDTPANRTAVLTALLDALPTDRMIDVRTPGFVDASFPGGPLTAAQAFTGTPRARTGHHNDCFLASASDFGTYDDPIEGGKDYVAADGRFTFVGGETCGVDAPRSECTSAVSEMTRLHWTYINALYHPDVLQGWQDEGCNTIIARHVGYHLVLTEGSYAETVAPGGVIRLAVQLRNDGFAPLLNPRKLEVTVTGNGTTLTAIAASVEPRTWAAGATAAFDVRFRIPATLAVGTYSLAIGLPDVAATLHDTPAYAVRFANTGLWDDATGRNVLTSALHVDATATGHTEATATTFAEVTE